MGGGRAERGMDGATSRRHASALGEDVVSSLQVYWSAGSCTKPGMSSHRYLTSYWPGDQHILDISRDQKELQSQCFPKLGEPIANRS